MMSEENQQQVPDEISYDSSDVKRSASKPQLRTTGPNEYFKGRVRGPATKGFTAKGHYQLSMEVNPLDAMNEPRYPTGRLNLQIPIKNKEREGHEAPKTGFLCRFYLEAVGATGILQPAKWNSDQGGWVKPDGTVIPRDQKTAADEYNLQAEESVIAAMVDRWKTPSLVENDTFFFQVQQDKKNPQYRNIVNVTGTLPGDATLITEKFAE